MQRMNDKSAVCMYNIEEGKKKQIIPSRGTVEPGSKVERARQRKADLTQPVRPFRYCDVVS
jgi:hypothetical protein